MTSLFPSLPGGAGVRHAMALNAEASRHLVDYHTVLLRGPSPLSEGERELIAAFVSGLNACRFCYGVHSSTAEAFGIEPGLLSRLLAEEDLASAPVRMRPMLKYARKLTLEQTRLTEGDAAAVFAAGWDERALHDTIAVASLFNFMNRFVHGHGLAGEAAILDARGKALQAEGYAPILQHL